jgi:hypothetical protein
MKQTTLRTVARLLVALGLAATGYFGWPLLQVPLDNTASSQPSAVRQQATPGAGESWRLGVTLEGSAAYANMAGRLTTSTAAVRSGRGQHLFFVFPAAAITHTVAAAHMNILSRAGGSDSDVSATLVAIDYDGNILRNLSAPLSARDATTGTWLTVPLTAGIGLSLSPAEVLAMHFDFGAGPAVNFDARPAIDVIVRP